jgi:hypothetical protein
LQKHEVKKMDILFNESTKLIEKIVIEQFIIVESPNDNLVLEVNQTSNITYSDYNKSNITLPDELQALISEK